jgi:hypothetical protein
VSALHILGREKGERLHNTVRGGGLTSYGGGGGRHNTGGLDSITTSHRDIQGGGRVADFFLT